MGRFGKVRTASGRSISLMSVTTGPDCGDMEFLVPKAGTYVVVQLDASQMVEPLEDPELLVAAQQLQTRKYIGYVYEVEELPMPFREDHICCIEFVGRGLCKDDEEDCVDSTMCTPIFPATQHPLSRESLRPKPAFPFPDCYHYTSATHAVRIPTGSYKLSKAVSLGDRDFMVDSLYYDEDDKRRRVRRKAKNTSSHNNEEGHPGPIHSDAARQAVVVDIHPPPYTDASVRCQNRVDVGPGTTMPSESCDAVSNGTAGPELEARTTRPQLSLRLPQVAPDPAVAGSASDTPIDTQDCENDDPCSSVVELMHMFMDPNPDQDRDLIPLVKVSLDLSEVSEVNDPATFLEEVEQIIQLIEDSRSRSQSLHGRTLSRQATSPSMRRVLDARVDLHFEASAGQDGPSKFCRILKSTRFEFGTRVQRVRRRCTSFLRAAKALAAAPFTRRLSSRLHVD